MSLAKKIIGMTTVVEGKSQDSKIKQLEGEGSRKARLTVKAAESMVKDMLDEYNSAPNPKTVQDEKYLKESMTLMKAAQERLKSVKESKKKLEKQYEDKTKSTNGLK